VTDLLYYAGGIAAGAALVDVVGWGPEEIVVMVAALLLIDASVKLVPALRSLRRYRRLREEVDQS